MSNLDQFDEFIDSKDWFTHISDNHHYEQILENSKTRKAHTWFQKWNRTFIQQDRIKFIKFDSETIYIVI